jgi:hypothetical protein
LTVAITAKNKTEDIPREKRYFTLAEADRTLPLVRRIVRDIMATYRQVLAVRNNMETLRAAGLAVEFESAQDQLYALVARAQEFTAELTEIGAQLKDWNMGLVDFPAVHKGHEVLLCWRPGEESVQHWHEQGEGFARRRSVASLDRRCRDGG